VPEIAFGLMFISAKNFSTPACELNLGPPESANPIDFDFKISL
jgi:hypothetical protein